jgi:hypothetical protein
VIVDAPMVAAVQYCSVENAATHSAIVSRALRLSQADRQDAVAA